MNEEARYLIEIILRARDELSGVLDGARRSIRDFQNDADRSARGTSDFDRSMRSLADGVEKLRDEMVGMRNDLREAVAGFAGLKREADDSAKSMKGLEDSSNKATEASRRTAEALQKEAQQAKKAADEARQAVDDLRRARDRAAEEARQNPLERKDPTDALLDILAGTHVDPSDIDRDRISEAERAIMDAVEKAREAQQRAEEARHRAEMAMPPRRPQYPPEAEMVPLEELRKFREFDRAPGGKDQVKDVEEFERLKAEIERHGIQVPVRIMFDPDTGMGHLGEGNHRFAIAEMLGIQEVPVVVVRSSRINEVGTGHPLSWGGEGRLGSDPLPPSQFGLSGRPFPLGAGGSGGGGINLPTLTGSGDDEDDEESRVEKLARRVVELREAMVDLHEEFRSGETNREDAALGFRHIGDELAAIARKAGVAHEEIQYEAGALADIAKRTHSGISQEIRDEERRRTNEALSELSLRFDFISEALDKEVRDELAANREVEAGRAKRQSFVLDLLREALDEEKRVQKDITKVYEEETQDRIRATMSAIMAEDAARRSAGAPSRADTRDEDMRLRAAAAERDLEAYDDAVRRNILTIHQQRFELRSLINDFTVVAMAHDRGTDAARRYGGMAEHLKTRMRELGRDTVDLDRDHRGFIATLDNMGAAFQRAGVHVRSLGSEMRGILILAVIGFFQQLATAAISLGGNLIALASSAAQAGAALGGALAAGAAQAIGPIALLVGAFQRVGAVMDAVKQHQNALQQGATQANAQNEKQADTAGRVADANRALTDAQDRLREAREQAAEQLEDYINAERRAELQARGASLSIEEAQRELREALTGGDQLRIAQARLGLDEARLARDEARDNLRGIREDAAEAKTLGVEGDPDVQRAARGVEAARRNVREVARDAQNANAQTVAAQRNLDYLLSQLSDSERRLYGAILGIQEAYRKNLRPITDIIVDSFSRTLERIAGVMDDPGLLRSITRVAGAIAGAVDDITDAFTSDEAIGQFSSFMDSAADNMGPLTDLFLNLADAFMDIAEAGGPAFRDILDWLVDLTDQFSEFTGQMGDADSIAEGPLANFFRDGVEHLKQWGELVGSVVNLFMALAGEGGGAESGLRIIDRMTDGINGWASSIRRHAPAVRRFFRDAEDVLGDIWRLIESIATAIWEAFEPDAVDALVDILVEVLVPALQEVIEAIGEGVQLLEKFLSLPLVGDIVKWGIILLGVSKSIGVFGGVIGALLLQMSLTVTGMRGFLTVLSSLGAGFRTLLATGSIRAAITAFKEYAAAVKTARTAGTAGPLGITPGRGRSSKRGRSGATGAAGGVPGGTIFYDDLDDDGRNRPVDDDDDDRNKKGKKRGRMSGPLAAGAKATLWGAAAIGALEFATGDGNVLQRGQNALSTITMGIIPSVEVEPKNKKALDDLGKQFEDLEKKRDYDGIADLQSKVSELADAARKMGNEELAENLEEIEKRAQEMQDKVKGFSRFSETLKGGLITPDDVIQPNAVAQFLSNLNHMRREGVTSISDLRADMKFNMDQMSRGIQEGSESWHISMARNFEAGVDALREAMANGTIDTEAGMKEIARITKRQMAYVRDNMDDMSNEARVRMAGNFGAAREAIIEQIGGIENATDKTLKRIRRLMEDELVLYGLSPEEARRLARNRTSKTKQDVDQHGVNERAGLATGGWIGNRGERGRDGTAFVGGVPVGRGELLVANAAQQSYIQHALLGQYGHGIEDLMRVRGAHAGELGSGWAGGFAGRSPAGYRTVPIPGQPGEFIAQRVLDEALSIIRRFSLRVTDAFATSGHQGAGHLRFGTAIDVVPGAGGSWDDVDAAVAWARARGMTALYDGVEGHGRGHHAHLELMKGIMAGPGGGGFASVARQIVGGASDAGLLGGIAQGAADMVREGAIASIRRAIGAVMEEGGEPTAGLAGAMSPEAVKGVIRRAMDIVGVPDEMRSAWTAMALARARQESGLVPDRLQEVLDVNSGGNEALGLMQVVPGTFAAYRDPSLPNDRANPLANMVASFNYMRSRYGEGDWSRALSAMLAQAGVGYQSGGAIPGFGGGDRWPILTEGGEHIWTKEEVQRAGGHGVMRAMRAMLGGGGQGGPTGYQSGGELGWQTRDRNAAIRGGDYRFPDIAPISPAGVIREIRRLNRALARVQRKGGESLSKYTDRFLAEIDSLTGEGGLLDQLLTSIDNRSARRAVKIAKDTYKTDADGTVRRRLTPAQVAEREARAADADLSDLREARPALTGALAGTKASLRKIDSRIADLREGKVTARERAEIERLLKRRQNASGAIRQLEQSVIDLDSKIAEGVAARYEAQVEKVDEGIRNAENAGAARGRRLDLAQAFLGHGLVDKAMSLSGASTRAGIFQARADSMGRQMNDLVAMRDEAIRLGLTERIAELNDSIDELSVAILDNTEEARQYRIQATQARLSLFTGAVGTAMSILEAVAGPNGTVDPSVKRSLLTTSGNEMRTADADWRTELGQMLGFDITQDLTSAAGLKSFVDTVLPAVQGLPEALRGTGEGIVNSLLQNTLAIVQNTQALDESKEVQVQNWSSSAWQAYRTAVFNGTGGLMPHLTQHIPTMHSGGPVLKDGLHNLRRGEYVLDDPSRFGETNINITQVKEKVDPIELSEVIAFRRKTAR